MQFFQTVLSVQDYGPVIAAVPIDYFRVFCSQTFRNSLTDRTHIILPHL